MPFISIATSCVLVPACNTIHCIKRAHVVRYVKDKTSSGNVKKFYVKFKCSSILKIFINVLVCKTSSIYIFNYNCKKVSISCIKPLASVL